MFCNSCGSQVDDGTKFCPNCGANLSGAESEQKEGQQYERVEGEYVANDSYQQGGYSGQSYQNPGSGRNVVERNIVLCIIFSIITCGIYGIYWMYVLNEDINSLSNHPEGTNGGLVILFSIITCGIYGWYWYYKMGERVEEIRAQKGLPSDSSAVLYLILGIVGLGIVNYCLMQSNINSSVR